MIEENIKPEQTLEMVGQLYLHIKTVVSLKWLFRIVTALQQIPVGDNWTKQKIEKNKIVTVNS